MTRSAEIDAYIAALPEPRAERLTAFRAAVHAEFSDVEEALDWNMPVFRSAGRFVAAASKAAYLSLYFGSDAAHYAIPQRIAATDKRLKHGKSCLNVTDWAPFPLDEIKAGIREILA